MSNEYPTVGLKFDLPEIVATASTLGGVEESFNRIGDAADKASAKGTKAAADLTAASKGTAAAKSAETAAATNSASAIQKADAQTAAQAQRLLRLRLALTAQMFGDETADATAAAKAAQTLSQQTFTFQQRMTAQQARENALATAQQARDNAAMLAQEVADAALADETMSAFLMDRSILSKRLADAEAAAHAAQVAKEVAEEEAAAALIEQMAMDVAAVKRRAYEMDIAAHASMLAEQAKADVAAAASSQKVLNALKNQAATAGMTKAELAAYRAEEAGITADAAPFVERIKAAEDAVTHMGGSSLKTRESLVILREGVRGDFTRMAGSATILANAFNVLPLLLNPLTLTIIAIAAAIGAFEAAAAAGEEQTAKFNNTLQITGNISGQTADSYERMISTISTSTNTGLLSVRKDVDELGSTGKFTADTIQLIAENAIHLSDYTGQSQAKVVQDFEKMSDGVAKFAETFNSQYHLLTEAQIEHIDRLEAEGQKQQAEFELQQDLYAALANKAPAELGLVGEAWRGLTGWIQGATQAVMNFGKQDPKSKQLQDEVQQALADSNEAVASAGRGDDSDASLAAANASAHMQKAAAIRASMAADNAAAAQTQATTVAQQKGTDALVKLKGEYRSFGGSVELANEQILDYRKSISDLRAVNPNSLYLPTADEQSKQEDKIRHQFDRNDFGKTPSHAGAENAVTKLTADVTGLQDQLNKVSADPLADLSAKIEKAANEAAAAYSHGKNTGYQEEVRALAAQKEEMTLRLQLVTQMAKETRAALDQAAALQVQTDARIKVNQVEDAYYASSDTSLTGYMAMQQQVSQIQQNAQDQAIELAAAQKFGATSIDGIADAYLRALPANIRNTAASVEAATKLQAQAKATVQAQEATDHLTEAEKRRAAIAADHTASEQQSKDTEAYTAALIAGTDALIAYNLQAGITANLRAHPAAANASPAEIQTQISQVTADETKKRIDQIAQQEAEITRQVNLQEDATTKTSEERAAQTQIDLETERLILKARQDGQTLSASDVKDAATQLVLAQQWQKKIADLKVSIQDTIRDSFIKTGKLDFSSLKQGVGEALRQAIYDQLLAKPINIVVNAVMNIATQGLQSLLNSVLNNGGQGIGSFVSSIFGGSGSGLSNALGLTKTASSLTSAAGSLSSAASGFSSLLGPIAAVAFLGGSIGSQIGKALGNQKGGTIGGTLFGVIGSIIGGLLGDHSGHATAVNFNSTGGVSGYSYSPKGSTTATIQLAQQTGVAVTQLLSQFKTMGINADNVLAGIEQGTRNDARTFLKNGQIIYTANGDSQALTDAVTKALYQYGTYSNAQEQKVVQQLLAANATLDQINTAVQAFQQAQQDYQGVTVGLLQYTDPTEYAIQNLVSQQIARRQTLQTDINAGYFSQDQINTLASTLPQLEQKEMQAALANLATSANGAATSLQDLVDAQTQIIQYVQGLQTSSLSNLSPEAILAQDKTNFLTSLTAAQGGDLTSLQGITGLSDSYLKDAQSYYGSSDAYNEIFTSVTDALTSLGTQTFGTEDTTAAITQGMQELKDAITKAGLDIVGAINDNEATTANGTALTSDQLAGISAALANGTLSTYIANLKAGGVL